MPQITTRGKEKQRQEKETTNVITEDNGIQSKPACLEDDDRLRTLDEKLDKILTSKDEQEKTLQLILAKLTKFENELGAMKSEITDLSIAAQNQDKDISELQCNLKMTITKDAFESLEARVDDLENRSKRKNLIFWNVPETAENSYESCEEFIESFIDKHMNLGQIEVERCHRTPTSRRKTTEAETKPRPIHVLFLRYQDKLKVLKNAAKSLKENPYQKSKVFITDDVSSKVRTERSFLRKNYLDSVRTNPQVLFAYIPWSVPARIIYKTTSNVFKTLKASDDLKRLQVDRVNSDTT